MQTATAQRILARAALIAPKNARLMSTSSSNMGMNMIKSRPNTFFKAEQAVMAPRTPKSSIDMTAADRAAGPYTSIPKPLQRTKMSLMSTTSPSMGTSTKTSMAMPTASPTKKSEVFRTQRPGFYGVSAIVRDFSTSTGAATVAAPAQPSSSSSSFSKVMPTTRAGFYGVSAFRSFSTASRNKEFFVGINADWPAQPAPPATPIAATLTKASKSKSASDNINLPEEHPTWRPVDDGKTLSESEARIPQDESERYVSCLP